MLPTSVFAFQQVSPLVVSHIRLCCAQYTNLCLSCQSPALAPYRTMNTGSSLLRLSFVWKLICLLFQIMLRLAIADVANATLILISFVEVPSASLLKADPICFKDSTSSKFPPFVMIIELFLAGTVDQYVAFL